MNEGYLNPGHWRYTATYTGDKAAGLNAKYDLMRTGVKSSGAYEPF